MKWNIFLLCCFCLFSLTFPFSKNSVLAVVKKANGWVEIRKDESGEWKKARPGSILRNGGEIRTKEKSQAVVKFLDNSSTVALLQTSAIQVNGVKHHHGLSKMVTLNFGTALFDVKKTGGSIFEVSTASSLISVKGTVFQVVASIDGKTTEVYGIEGLVAVLNNETNEWHDIAKDTKAVSDSSGITKSPLNNKNRKSIEEASKLIFKGTTVVYDDSYSLTVLSQGPGATMPSKRLKIRRDSVISIQAMSDTGCYFIRWKISGGSAVIDDPESFQTTLSASSEEGDVTVTAIFSSAKYKLRVLDDSKGRTSPSGEIEAFEGIPVDISALSDSTYHFLKWKIVSGTPQIKNIHRAKTSVSLDSADGEIMAEFSRDQVKVNFSADSGGTITPAAGDTMVDMGAEIQLLARTKPGFSFCRWQITGQGMLEKEYDAAASLKIQESDVSVKAIFTKHPVKVDIITSPFGTISHSGVYTLQKGDTLRLGASSNPGYHFQSWEVLEGLDEVRNPNDSNLFITVSADLKIKPRFKLNTYTITLVPSAFGEVRFPPQYGDSALRKIVYHSQSVNISAEPKSGYHFVKWESNSSNVNVEDPRGYYTYVSVIEDNVVLTPVIERNITQLSFYKSHGGSTRPSKAITVPTDSAIHISAESENDYFFVSWKVVEGSADIAKRYSARTTLRTFSSKVVVKALFTNTKYKLTLEADQGGTIDPSPGELVIDSGKAVTLNAIPSDGFLFRNWESRSGKIVINSPGKQKITVNPIDDKAVIKAHFIKKLSLLITHNLGGSQLCNSSAFSGIFRPGSQLVVKQRIPKQVEAQNSLLCSYNCRYIFTGWTFKQGNGKLSNQFSRTTNVTLEENNAEIVANYQKISKTITVLWNTDLNDEIQVTGKDLDKTKAPGHLTIKACDGQQITLSPIENNGEFIRWSASRFGSIPNPNLNITVKNNETIQAVFGKSKGCAKVFYTFKDAVYQGQHWAPSFISGDWVPLSLRENFDGNGQIAPNIHWDKYKDRYYTFDKWIVSEGKAKIKDPTSVFTFFTVDEGCATIIPSFKIVTSNLTLRSNQEGVTITPKTSIVDKGVWAPISAIPSEKSMGFVKWNVISGNVQMGNQEQNSRVRVLSPSAVLEAEFTRNKYTVSLKTEMCESTIPIDKTEVYEGFEATLRALPGTKNYFSSWKTSGQGVQIFSPGSSNTKIKVTGSTEVTAVCKEKSILTVKSGLQCEAKPHGQHLLEPSNSFTISVVPAFEHYFEIWNINNGESNININNKYRKDTYVNLIGGSAEIMPVCYPWPMLTQNRFVCIDGNCGLQIGTSQKSRVAPGSRRGISVDQSVSYNGKEYKFDHWETEGPVRISSSKNSFYNTATFGKKDMAVKAYYSEMEHSVRVTFTRHDGKKSTLEFTYK